MGRIILLLLSITLSLNSLIAQEVLPSSPAGGKSQLKYFIEQELIYPEMALQAKTEGNCQIKYSINEKGHITHIIFLNKVSPDCDQETLRIFNMIEWEPATKIGIPVADSGIFEIEFNFKIHK